MWCSTASTTTIASSTTRPIASTRPNSDSVLIEKPSSGKTMNVPISDTGTAISGISVARQFCRNRKTTRTTSTIASTRVIEDLADALRHGAGGVERELYSRSVGEALAQLVHLRCGRPRATSSAFEPGAWKTRDGAARLAVDAADLLVVQRAELDARDVAQPDHRAVRVRAHHDRAELLLGLQAALRAHRVGHLLAGGRRARRRPGRTG